MERNIKVSFSRAKDMDSGLLNGRIAKDMKVSGNTVRCMATGVLYS